jgi:hypothetical protein
MILSVVFGLYLRKAALWNVLLAAWLLGSCLSTLTQFMLTLGKAPVPRPMRLAALRMGRRLGRAGSALLDFAQRLADDPSP